MATKVLILAHSFISRFYDFLRFNVRADVFLRLPRGQYRLHQRKMFASDVQSKNSTIG
jgi:hypothetical protein